MTVTSQTFSNKKNNIQCAKVEFLIKNDTNNRDYSKLRDRYKSFKYKIEVESESSTNGQSGFHCFSLMSNK